MHCPNHQYKYFQLYADEHSARDYIQFRHDVTKLEQAADYEQTGRWQVTTLNLDTGLLSSKPSLICTCNGKVKPKKKILNTIPPKKLAFQNSPHVRRGDGLQRASLQAALGQLRRPGEVQR